MHKPKFPVAFLLIVCLSTMLAVSANAAGEVTVTYNTGGSISVLSSVSQNGNTFTVEDDKQIDFQVTADAGYLIQEIYQDDTSMNMGGTTTRTVTVTPNNTSVRLRVMFIQDGIATQYPGSTTHPLPSVEPGIPPAASSAPEDGQQSQGVEPSPPPSPTPVVEPAKGSQPASLPVLHDSHSITTSVPTKPPTNTIGADDIIPPAVSTGNASVEKAPNSLIEDDSNIGVGSLEAKNNDTLSAETYRLIGILAGCVLLAAVFVLSLVKRGKRHN